MTAPALFTEGKPLQLGSLIGRGGEGEVYALKDSANLAVKIYTVDPATREQKIAAMVAARLAEKSPLIAFPRSIVVDRNGRFAGFTMNRVADHKPLFDLYKASSRKMAFPLAGYPLLVGAAANIAWLIDKVHQAGCVIGDINESGILVSREGKPALIDADSFQVSVGERNFLCAVGKQEYTPPELFGQPLASTVRTQNHDAFGLAVVIFQLLLMGRHPFMGTPTRGEIPFEQAIRESRYAYSSRRDTGLKPPPHVCTPSDLPEPIRDAFERAFDQKTRDVRPDAATWVRLLIDLQKSLVQCSANKLHHYASGAAECPWCRMDRRLGMTLFLPPMAVGAIPTMPAFDPSEGGFNLAAVWAAIQAVQIVSVDTLEPPLPTLQVAASAEAMAAKPKPPSKQWGTWILRAGLVAGCVALCAAAPAYFILWFVLLCVGLAWTRDGTKKAMAASWARFESRYSMAETTFQRAKHDWRVRMNAAGNLTSLKNELAAARAAYLALPDKQRQRMAAFDSARRQKHLHAFLDTFEISREQFPGIGPARRKALVSYGVETAADCTEAKLYAIPGFGPAICAPLIAWRRAKEQRFVYNAALTAADAAAVNKIKGDIKAEAQRLRQRLTSGATELGRQSAELSARLKHIDSAVAEAYRAKLQAETDLAELGRPLPYVTPFVAPAFQNGAVNAGTSTAARTGSGGSPACPVCGSQMRTRKARKGRHAGSYFWGCVRYPGCRGRRPI